MVRVDVDDENVVEIARMRLFARVRQESGGVEFFDGDAATAIGNQIHGMSPGVLVPFIFPNHTHRPVQLCHIPSSNTARSAARSNPLAVSITSVAEIECFGTGVNCSPASVRAL